MDNSKTYTAFVMIGVALIAIGAYTMPIRADNVAQTVEMVRVDVEQLSTGFRATKLLGASVVNDANNMIGKIDDILVSPNDNKSAFVIVSVGGFLGMGNHLVAFPFDSLHITSSKITLPGVTKDGLKSLPEFKYNKM